jgi:hypothetical protein
MVTLGCSAQYLSVSISRSRARQSTCALHKINATTDATYFPLYVQISTKLTELRFPYQSNLRGPRASRILDA